MLATLQATLAYFLRPIYIVRGYRSGDLRSDLIAGLTVSVVLLPQAIVFALLARLPPEMGLYSAIVGAIVGALWGSSNQLHSGPTNTASILVLATLAPLASPGTQSFMLAAGLLAVMVGIFRLMMGLARLGMLVNFVSDAVTIGFTAGAGVLIIVGELRYLLRIDLVGASGVLATLQGLALQLTETHLYSLGLGLLAIMLLVGLRVISPKLPGPLIGMAVAGALVWGLGLDGRGVRILGDLPRSLPPLAQLPLFDLALVGHLSTGALALAAIGLVEATAISRGLATQSGQRLDNNQEFVGQGLANIACGLLSGFPCSGSFNRSALNYQAGARTALAGVCSGLFVLAGMLLVGPLAAYVPRAALAGALIVIAIGMIDHKRIVRIWRGARGDAAILVLTLLATLLLSLQFAVLIGILMSLAYYILKTSAPRVHTVVPDDNFRHFVHQPQKPVCPQLGIMDILGDLYFGAAGHVEESIHLHRARYPGQRFLLLRMQSVDYCDISGIHMLESVVRGYRDQGGDVYMVRVQEPVARLMEATGFSLYLGADHFLAEDDAIEHLFNKVLDPAICIYESGVRVFRECQNLPRPDYAIQIPLQAVAPVVGLASVPSQTLWQQLRGAAPPLVVDVREPREFKQGHIPQARLLPLSKLLAEPPDLPRDQPIVLVCRSGRRSVRAAARLHEQGYHKLTILQGGMLAWENAGLLAAIER
jgi:SulP family sulfate permease